LGARAPQRLPVDGLELPVGVGHQNRRRGGSAEPDFDGQPAPGLRFGDDGRIVSGGNGFYDGETEAVPLALAEPGTIEPLEGLEEPLDVAGIDHGAGVGDRQVNQAAPGAGPSRAEPPGVLWRKALCTKFATSLSTRCGPPVVDAGSMSRSRLTPSPLASGRAESTIRSAMAERSTGWEVSSPWSLVANVRRASISLSCASPYKSSSSHVERRLALVVARVGEGELKKGAFQCERGAQLVGRIGDKPAL
jgi:hypothetical protein